MAFEAVKQKPMLRRRAVDSGLPIGNFARATWLFEPAGLPPRKTRR
jgi:hypothetical protein